MFDHARFEPLINRYRTDPESVYTTWFINSADRLKAFRAIRCGVEQVVSEIKAGTFGNDFSGSSLELVLKSITEQKQVFEGAAHAFYWKPKLRIPDIYENETNKTAFGQFLDAALCASKEEHLLREIASLDARRIKGLGPAVANILYFLHPTLLPPSNTAILNGFNLLLNEKKKLGSWSSYLEMRGVMIALNDEFRTVLSKDLGAISGLLFEIGAGKLVIEQSADLVLEIAKKKIEAVRSKRHAEVVDQHHQDETHARMQLLLTKLGKALGYDVLVASNDRGKSVLGEKFSFHCLCSLPDLAVSDDVAATIALIDILWFEKGTNRVACAFEVEKSTSIYSGLLRLADLTLSLPDHAIKIFLVAPDDREKEVLAQLKRPAVLATRTESAAYILFSDLDKHCEAMCRFGTGREVLDKICRSPKMRPRA
jgi:type II restriction enzyme